MVGESAAAGHRLTDRHDSERVVLCKRALEILGGAIM